MKRVLGLERGVGGEAVEMREDSRFMMIDLDVERQT